jgi:hypothetical protein
MSRKVEILDGHIVADTGPAPGTDGRLRGLAPVPPPATYGPRAGSGLTVNEDQS